MPINYDKAYNAEIRKAVRHYNQVRKTLSKHGIKLASAPIRVSELKARYQTRRELNRELTLLKKVSSSDDRLLKEVELSGGATAIKWNLDYLKQNTRNAIKYFKWERELEMRRNPKYPHEFERINEIDMNLKYLEMELDSMNQEQFNAYSGSIREYLHINELMKRGYRGFLYQIETSMRVTGFSEEDIKSVFKELKKLNPVEFREWYKTNDLIKRIYELVPSDPHGTNKLTTTMGDAREFLEMFMETFKDDIAKIKSK